MAMTNLRICFVDDDESIRVDVVRAVELADRGMTMVAFSRPSELLGAVGRGDLFDVALVDLGLPEMNGDLLIAELRRRCPALPVVAFTVRDDDDAVFSALRAGAVGYITKRTTVEHLIDAVHAAAQGAAPLSPTVSRRVVAKFWLASSSIDAVGLDLTPRERDVLEVLCGAASYRETAALLGISQGTVQTYVKRIYGKLGVNSKAEAMRVAFAKRDVGRG